MTDMLDIYYGELIDALQLIDSRVSKIDISIKKAQRESIDPDALGLCDQGEYYIGLGFTVCQKYISSSCGVLKIKKGKALQIGPFHESGVPIVKIINAVANYWKHKDEWEDIVEICNIDKEFLGIAYRYYENLTAQEKRTIDTIETVTPWATYTCSNILASISSSDRLNLIDLGELLKKWYNNCKENLSCDIK